MPQTRRQRGGVRSASLFKRGPSSYNKVLRRYGSLTLRRKSGRAAPAPPKLTEFQRIYLTTITEYMAPKAAGKEKDQFKLLGRMNLFLEACAQEYKKHKTGLLHDSLTQMTEAILEELPDLVVEVYNTVKETGSPVDAPFLDVLEMLRAKYEDDLLVKGYGHRSGSIQQVSNMIDDFIAGFQRATANLSMMNRFVASGKPSAFAKELSAVIGRAIVRGRIWEALQPQKAPAHRAAPNTSEGNALAALLGGLTVADKPLKKNIHAVFGTQGAEEMPEEEGNWGGEDRPNNF